MLFKGVTIPRPEAWRLPTDDGLPYEKSTLPIGESEWISGWYIPGRTNVLVVGLPGYVTMKSSMLNEAAVSDETLWLSSIRSLLAPSSLSAAANGKKLNANRE